MKKIIKFATTVLALFFYGGVHASVNQQSYSIHLAVQANKLVTVYLLIDSPKQLQQYVDDLAKVQKPNFNRVIFSFVKPTLTKYTSGSLANTGILGYFEQGDGQSKAAF